MSASVSNIKPSRVQKICTLWTHDDNFSREEFLFNGDKFPELPTTLGTVLQIAHINSGTTIRDFQPQGRNAHDNRARKTPDRCGRDASADSNSKRGPPECSTITIDENGAAIPGGREAGTEAAYVFAAKALPADLKSKHPNLQVSTPK
jgi:DEP domain-containing protein 5